MRFLADMGVAAGVVDWLRQNGHDAKHLRDEELHRIPNGEIFAKAISENRIIITFDLDFGEIVALSKKEKASIILFRLHNTRTSHLINRLSTVLEDSVGALKEGERAAENDLKRLPATTFQRIIFHIRTLGTEAVGSNLQNSIRHKEVSSTQRQMGRWGDAGTR
jgi:predicted nuclease of predicted toxin-antitoxin system